MLGEAVELFGVVELSLENLVQSLKNWTFRWRNWPNRWKCFRRGAVVIGSEAEALSQVCAADAIVAFVESVVRHWLR